MTCFHFPEIRRCRFCRAIPSNSTLVKMKLLFLLLLLWRVLGQGVSGVGPDGVAVNVMEGDSVTLNTSVKTNQQEKIRWYFNAIRIAEISGDLSHICRDVQCNKGTERFRGRLKLDHQTGSLTITNTRTTDSGNYHLKISNSYNSDSGKTFIVAFHGVSGVSPDGVSVFVMEEDSVTLNTGVKTNQDRQDRIRWYFNDTRIAQISVALSKICTDVQCNGGTERFRDRLKLDHQTGSLTIMNITNTDTGHYILKISSRNNNESIKTFIFAVHGVFAAERDEMKRKSVKEGEAVTLDPCEVKNPNDLMTWYFNDMPMAKINRDLSHICTDDQFRERFRDTLKLDHQTGSLTITNTRTTDSALYKLQINSSRFSIIRSFNVTVTGVTVTAVSDPRPPSAAAAVIRAAVIVSVIVGALLVAGVIYYRYRRSTQATQNETGMPHNDHQNGIPMQVRGPLIQPSIHYCPLINGRSPNQNGAPSVANGTSQLHNLLFK